MTENTTDAGEEAEVFVRELPGRLRLYGRFYPQMTITLTPKAAERIADLVEAGLELEDFEHVEPLVLGPPNFLQRVALWVLTKDR